MPQSYEFQLIYDKSLRKIVLFQLLKLESVEYIFTWRSHGSYRISLPDAGAIFCAHANFQPYSRISHYHAIVVFCQVKKNC